MPNNFIHYLPRKIIQRFPKNIDNPWFSELQGIGAGFEKPTYHTARSENGVASKVLPGDTIWIVSQIFSPWGRLPPAIDARIDVETIAIEPKGKYHYKAAQSSQWFPLSDARELLSSLESIDSKGGIFKLQKSSSLPIGQCLQSMRRLNDDALLRQHQSNLEKAPVNFISYRICDGTLGAFRKVRELLAANQVIFWDRWGLPRRLAERREIVDDFTLDKHLMKQLQESSIVWGIESPHYSKHGSYSAKERDAAIDLGKYTPVNDFPLT